MDIPGWSELRPFRKAEITMLVVFTIWLSLVMVAPFTLPPGSVVDLSGKVGDIDNGEQLEQMNPLARVVYTIGDINCHQLSERSYYLNGNQMPFCSRDVGLFIGLVAGLILAIVSGLNISILILLLLLVPLGVDGVLQLVTDYESSNALRMITGVVGGVGVGMILSRFAHRMLEVENDNSTITD